MSKQDTHFFNVFSLVIALLAVVAICIFVFARMVGAQQDAAVREEPMYSSDVSARVESPVHEAVAGQDNTALAIKPTTTASAAGSAAPAMPKTGKELFEQTCSVCHGQGIAGAPKAGDKPAWAARIAEGKPTLYQHALNGYQGGAGGGVMPAKGGRPDVPDDVVKQAVDYMVGMVH